MSFIAIILANLPAEIGVISSIVKWIMDIRSAAQQNNVWTSADETAFLNWLSGAINSPQWQTDAERAVPTAVSQSNQQPIALNLLH